MTNDINEQDHNSCCCDHKHNHEEKECKCKCDHEEKKCECEGKHEEEQGEERCSCEHSEEGCKCKNEDQKVEEKQEEKDPLTLAEEKVADLEDRYKRLLAEFDNFRKRSEKENIQMCDIGTSIALTKILPVVDNIERALTNVPEDLKENAFVEGVDKTYKQILKAFEEMEVKPIEAKGKMFDANLHNAVMTDETSEAEVDTITEELQKGWMYKDQVLRHSMVKVKK